MNKFIKKMIKTHLGEVSVHILHNVGAYLNIQQTDVIPLRTHVLLSMQAGTDTHCPVTPGLSPAHQILFVRLMEEGRSRAGKVWH